MRRMGGGMGMGRARRGALASGTPRGPFPTAPLIVADHTSWVGASGVSVNTAGTYGKAHPSGRTTGTKLTKNPTTGTFGGARRTSGIPAGFKLSDYALVGMDVRPDILAGSVSVRFSSDSFATKRVEYSWPFPSQTYANDWNRLTARVLADTSGIDPNGAWVVTGGMAMNEVVNAVQISMSTTANQACVVDIGSVFAFSAVPVRGVVMFGFDRYTDASLTGIALPIAQSAGIRCYAAGDTDLLVPRGAGWGRVVQLHDAGWPIISQGPDHKNYVTAGGAQLTTDVATSRTELQAAGVGNALDWFAYPSSANNAETDAALLAAGFKMATTGIGWNGHPNEYNLGYKLIGQGRVNIGGMTLTQVKRLIDRAALYGVIVDLFCHGLTAGGTGTTPPVDTLLWYADDWAAAIAYAKTVAVDILDPVTLFNLRGSLPVLA